MDEHELQQRLHRAVEGATPDSARLWENVMDASEHARKVRNAKRTGISLAVLAFAIATPIALNMANSPDDGGFAAPTGSGSPTTEPTPTKPTYAYVDTELNITFPLPEGWEISEFEAHRTAHPSALPAPPQDGDTVYVSATYGDLAPKQGRTEITLSPSGLTAEEVITDTQHWIVVQSWPVGPASSFEPQTVSIWSEATNDELAAEHQDGIDAIFDGLMPLYDANGALATIDADLIQTRRGTATDVPVNGATATVMAFMDTRAWIEDYGAFVSDEAVQQYADLEMPDGTSRRDFPEKWFLSTYDIVSADAADANSWEIVVEIDFVKYGEGSADEEHAIITERLFVGPGTAASGDDHENVVRGVADES